MLTYVINTSENRTLDSDKLFDLSGYNKIRWINCSLSGIRQCAQHIYEKQNVLGAEPFRVAILIDFFGFDRIRQPYGRMGYSPEEGVDISLYLPYIEIYLLDNLIRYLNDHNILTSDFEIYYIQNSKIERLNFLDNANQQLRTIVAGRKSDEAASNDSLNVETEAGSDEEVFDSFDLYCTKNVTLTFPLIAYPYGASKLTLDRFLTAFSERIPQTASIKRHYYTSSYGGGNARAAFDTLTLSLHLILMYEREEASPKEGEIELSQLDPNALKDTLVTAWNKVYQARILAKSNSITYYSLKDNLTVDDESLQPKIKAGFDIMSVQQRKDIEKTSPFDLYDKIKYYYFRTPDQLAADRREEFDRCMNDYLVQRDETKEIDLEGELNVRMRDGTLVTTPQFPSEEEFNHLAEEKEKEISVHFSNVLSAMFIDADFTEEKKRADKAFGEYKKVKACMHKSIIGDVIFLILALLSAVGPYFVLQLRGSGILITEALLLGLRTTLLFGGLFVLSVAIQAAVLTYRFKKAKKELIEAYEDCYRKECDSLVQIRHKFNEDLIFIEKSRYELRQLRHLYEANLVKDANIRRHRDTLDELQDHIGTILNKLDIEPVLDEDETVANDFDITKPIRAKVNRVYRVFSIETIEKLFKKKGSDKS